MEFLIILSTSIIGMIILRFTRHKEITRISWDKIAQFCGFMVLLTVGRIASYDLMLKMGVIYQLPQIPPEIMDNKWSLALVFWEDFFFGVPLYFIHKYMNGSKIKYVKWILTVAISIIFGMSHMYQGWGGVAITTLLPYFICLKYGRKYGFGTTMVCHILYDSITVYSIILLPYLLFS